MSEGLIYLASNKTRRRSTNSAVGAGTNSNNVRVYRTGDTVLRLSIQLRQCVPYHSIQSQIQSQIFQRFKLYLIAIKDTIVYASFLNISNSSLLHNVPHDKPLDGLVLYTTPHESNRIKLYISCLFGCLSASAAASMRTVVVRFADTDAAAYYIATADFIGVSRRTQLPASTTRTKVDAKC